MPTPRKEMIPGVMVDSTVVDGVRTVKLDIRYLGAALELTQEEAVTIARQLRYHGFRGRTHHQNIPREEPDEAITLRLLEDRESPYEVPIPYGQKDIYAVELRNHGWSYNEIMLRLRISGVSIKRAFEREGVQ